MKETPYTRDAVANARQIIAMDNELQDLRSYVTELEGYRQKYFDLLNSSTAHSGHMLAGILQLAMKPGVMEAVAKANEA